MAEPVDEFERILADARAQLGRISLKVDGLEEKGGVAVAPAAPEPAPFLSVPAVEPRPLPVIEAPAPVAVPVAVVPAPGQPVTPRPGVSAGSPVTASRVLPAPPRPGPPAWAVPAAVAAVVLVASLLVYGLRREGGISVSPGADALTFDSDGRVLAAAGGRIDSLGQDPSAPAFAALERPLVALCAGSDAVFGADGGNELLLWPLAGAAVRRFRLDHEPRSLFVRDQTVWTQDAAGVVRQFLLTTSMTGVFLQPLDKAALPGGPTGPFMVDPLGALLSIDAHGRLLRYPREAADYASPTVLRSWVAGARLVPGPGAARVLIPTAEGGTRLEPL